MTIPLHGVAETPIYLARAEKLMSEAERISVIDLLAASPEVGDLIPGTGGLRNGADTSYITDTIYLGAGESFDAIFTAPPKVGAGYDTYLLYNNALGALTKPGGAGLGGQMTEVRVYAAGALSAQTAPNT